MIFNPIRVLIVLLSLLAFGCEVTVSDAEFVAKAEQYLDSGDIEAASIELKNALQQNPNNERARWLLGKLSLEIGDGATAEKELRRAAELGVVADSVLPLLAQSLLIQGKYTELPNLSLEGLGQGQPRSDVWTSQGLAQMARGQLSEAERTLDLALQSAPDSSYALTAKARLLEVNKRHSEARRLLERILSQDPNYSPAWNMLGDLEVQQKALEKAELAYINAAANRVNNFSDLLQLALVRVELEKYSEAQKDIDLLMKRARRHPDVHFAQALLHYRNDRLSDAQDSLQIAVGGGANQVRAYYFMALTQYKLGNHAQAERYGRQYVDVSPDSVAGRKLMAMIELNLGHYQTAEKLIRPVVKMANKDAEAINLLAVALGGQGNDLEMTELLGQVVELKPDSAAAQIRYGAGLLKTEKEDKGREYIYKGIELDPGLQIGDVLLITYYLEQQKLDQALVAAEAFRDRHAQNITPYNLLGRVYIAMEQTEDAVRAFEKAKEFDSGNPAANQGLASIAVAQNDRENARKHLETILDEHPGHLSTLLNLATLDALENKQQGMIDHLQQAIEANPEAIQPRTMLARHYLQIGEPEQVLSLLVDLDKSQRDDPAVLLVLAMSELEQQQYPEARLSLQRLLETQPDFSQAHLLLARAHAGLGERDKMRSALERSLALDPSNFRARLALARLLLLEGDKKGVSEQIDKLSEVAPDHPSLLRLKASLALQSGDQDVASSLLTDVFDSSPNTANMLSVALLKWNAGDREAALRIQEQWVREHPEDMVAMQALAESYLDANNPNLANDAYIQILEKDEDSVIALNNLAWNLQDIDPEQALEYAVRANTLKPESPGVMDTLAVVYLKNGEIELARRLITRALEVQPNNPAYRYHAAQIEAAFGNTAEAIVILRTLLAENQVFSEKLEAEKLLWELKRS